MAAYRQVYDSRHLQADCQEPGSAPEPYARQSSMGYLYLFKLIYRCFRRSGGYSGAEQSTKLPNPLGDQGHNRFLGPTRVHNISIGSAVLAQLTVVTNRAGMSPLPGGR